MVLYDLSEHLRRKHLLLAFRVAKLLFLSVLLLVVLFPSPLLLFQLLVIKVAWSSDLKHFSDLLLILNFLFL